MSPADLLSFSLLNALGGAAIRAIALAIVAALTIRLLRIRSAAAQHAVWTVVTVAMLVLPVASAFLPPLRLPVALRAPVRPAAVVPPVAAPVQRAAPIVMLVNENGLASVSEVVSRPFTLWAICLAGAYLLGLVMVSGRIAAELWGVSRLIARAHPLRNSAANGALTKLADERQIPFPRPALYDSDDVAVPVFIAGHGNAMVLPVDWRDWDGWKLRAVLSHELAHALRRDGFSAALSVANRAIFWFHPLAWWLERRVTELCEQASDDSAISATGDAARYAEVLLEMAAEARNRGGRLMSPAMSAMSMAGVSGAARRIHKVLDADTVASGVLSAGRWWAAVAVAAPVIGLVAAAQIPAARPARGDVSPSWQYIQEGFQIKPDMARELEVIVERDPDDLASRGKLLAYYLYNVKHDEVARHARWVVEHYPGSELAASGIVQGAYRIIGDRDPARLEQSQRDFNALWLRQAALHDGDGRVVGNAGRALMTSDPSEAERLLVRALQLDSTNGRWKKALAELYAGAIRSDAYSQTGASSFGRLVTMGPGFAAHARSQLEKSADGEVIGLTGAELAIYVLHTMESGPGMEAQIAQARGQVASAGRALLTRALVITGPREEWGRILKELDANHWRMMVMVPRSAPATELNAPAVAPLETPTPEYPAVARQARIQGVVRFRVRVGADGRVAKIELLSGHPLLVPAAMETVRKYVYRATGAEFQTTADVNFVLPG
jgi:TonB family protein